MLQRLTAVLVVLLAITFSSSTLAQDVKKDVKKDTKPAVVNDAQKGAKPAPATAAKKDVKKSTKPPTFKYVACNQAGCGFWAKSHSRKELQSMIKKHSKRHHKIELTDKQVKDMVKLEGAK